MLPFKSTVTVLLLSCTTYCYSACAQDKGKDDANCVKETNIDVLAKTVAEVNEKIENVECPKLTRDVERLCLQIAKRYPSKYADGPESLGKYKYEATIYEASCISPSEINTSSANFKKATEKVRNTWDKYVKTLDCSDFNGAATGQTNILKYAASTGFRDFIENAISWKVDMNHQPIQDKGKTFLDFLEEGLAGSLNESTREDFQYFKELAIKNGAKRSSELKK